MPHIDSLKQKLHVGRAVEVRTDGGRGWVTGVVDVMSPNGRSLLLTLEETLGVGEFVISPEGVVLMLIEIDGAYRDLQTTRIVELRLKT